MYRGERKERRAYIRFIISLLKNMSIMRLRQALEAVLEIANG